MYWKYGIFSSFFVELKCLKYFLLEFLLLFYSEEQTLLFYCYLKMLNWYRDYGKIFMWNPWISKVLIVDFWEFRWYAERVFNKVFCWEIFLKKYWQECCSEPCLFYCLGMFKGILASFTHVWYRARHLFHYCTKICPLSFEYLPSKPQNLQPNIQRNKFSKSLLKIHLKGIFFSLIYPPAINCVHIGNNNLISNLVHALCFPLDWFMASPIQCYPHNFYKKKTEKNRYP